MFDMLSSDRRTARFMILPGAVGRQRRDRHEDQRQAGQPPVEPERRCPGSSTIRSGSRITLLSRVFSPWPTESMSLVNRDDQLGRALVAEARQVERHRPAEEVVADVEEGQLHDVGDQHFLEEQEEPLERDARHDQADQEQEGLEAVVRQVAVDPGLEPAVAAEPARRLGPLLGPAASRRASSAVGSAS